MRLFIIVTVSISISMLAISQETTSPTRVDLKTAEKVFKNKALILDVRTPSEYESGHLPGAKLIPVGELSDRLDEITVDKDEPVLVYCAVGGRSRRAAEILAEAGFTQVSDMKDGFRGWSRANLPSETGPEIITETLSESTEEYNTYSSSVEKTDSNPDTNQEESTETESTGFFSCSGIPKQTGSPLSSFIVVSVSTLLLWSQRRNRIS